MSVPIPAYLASLVTTSAPLIAIAVAGGLWLALGRTAMRRTERIAAWASIGVPLLLWFAAAWVLGKSGALESQPSVLLAPIAPAIALPIIVGIVLLARSSNVAATLDAIPASWLVGVQFYRALGFVFLALFARGMLPGEFALPAGIGDVLVGIAALALAFWLPSGSALSRKAAYAWNALGIADLVIAITTGFLTAPGPLQQLALDRPNTLITAYPLVMVPAFAVPLSIILHVLSLWQLNRQGERVARETNAFGGGSFAHS
ncbi:MAG: hypothetical protein ACLPPF_10210 [Rhodomicrobium sp.]